MLGVFFAVEASESALDVVLHGGAVTADVDHRFALEQVPDGLALPTQQVLDVDPLGVEPRKGEVESSVSVAEAAAPDRSRPSPHQLGAVLPTQSAALRRGFGSRTLLG